jgi:hypothetical protein
MMSEHMMEPSQPPSLELRQTREFTAREKGDLTRLWGKLVWRKGVGRLYTVFAYLWYGFAAFLALSVLMAVKRLAPTEPTLSDQLALAAIGFAVCLVSVHWLSDRLYRGQFWTERRTGDLYAMTPDGLHSNTVRGAFVCSWRHIEYILNDDRHLIALLPGNGGMFIVKSAFDGQDVAGFGTELVRRWKQNCASSQPEPAP